MKMTNLWVAALVGAGLALSVTAQAAETKGEKVDLKSLPAEVQKTINEKAAGGKIVKVMREDDVNGKWNYEVWVKTDGKEWGFEVDPKGKFVKKHDEAEKGKGEKH
jgi:uncharacterized membrane protein YkoI